MVRKNSQDTSKTKKIHIILTEELKKGEQFPNTERGYLVRNYGLLKRAYTTDIVVPKNIEDKCYMVLHFSRNDGFRDGELLTAKKSSSEEDNSRLLYQMAREIAEYRTRESGRRAKLLDKTRMSKFI